MSPYLSIVKLTGNEEQVQLPAALGGQLPAQLHTQCDQEALCVQGHRAAESKGGARDRTN